MKKIDKLYKELDKLVMLRHEYLSTNSNYYKNEVSQVNKRISELHNLIFKLKKKNDLSDNDLYNVGSHF